MSYPSWKDLKGEALMDYLLNSVVQRKEVIKEINEQIEDGLVTFKHRSLNQEAILHPSSKKEGVFQFTYFDKKGAIGDFEAITINEVATKVEDYGFDMSVVN